MPPRSPRRAPAAPNRGPRLTGPRARPGIGRVEALIAIASLPIWAALLAFGLQVPPDCRAADAILVLAGSDRFVERARAAAARFRAGAAPVVLLTDDGGRAGWSAAEQRNPRYVELAARELARDGVPAARIRVVPGPAAGGTMQEARLVRAYARGHGLRSLLVVTSGYHARRARWTYRQVFRRTGVATRLCPAPPGPDGPAPLTWWLRPAGWRLVAGEYVKLLGYRLRYG